MPWGVIIELFIMRECVMVMIAGYDPELIRAVLVSCAVFNQHASPCMPICTHVSRQSNTGGTNTWICQNISLCTASQATLVKSMQQLV